VSWIYAHRYLIARRIVAGGTLGLFWLGANAHLGVLTGNLSSSRLFRTVPLSDPFAVLQILATGQPLASTVLVGALIVVLLYTVLGGRSFCGWVCPVGLIGDGARWWKRHFKIRGQFHLARSARFWIMALALLVSAATGVAAFEWLSPIGIIQRELIYGAGLGTAMIDRRRDRPRRSIRRARRLVRLPLSTRSVLLPDRTFLAPPRPLRRGAL